MGQKLQERLLSVLDKKTHWSAPHFAAGQIPLDRLKPHFEQEWEVTVRDFPVLLARVLGLGPPAKVRHALARQLYEGQTGGLSGTAPHAELFLRMMAGCGYEPISFNNVQLLPEAAAWRAFLDRMTWATDWLLGAAVLTLFVEGRADERQQLAALQAPPRPAEDIATEREDAVAQDPLVRVHQVAPAALEFVRVRDRAHASRRRDAWELVLGHTTPEQEDAVSFALDEALRHWLHYRDAVASACGLTRD